MALIEMSSVEESILALIVSDDGVLFVLTNFMSLFVYSRPLTTTQ